MREVLPYLEVEKDNLTEEEVVKEVEVPKVEGLSITEAKKVLEEAGLDISYEETEEENSSRIITNQIPIEGIKVNSGTKVIVE